MSAIKGLHHVALKVVPEEFNKVVEFYRDFLEMPVVRACDTCAMLGFGNTILEIIAQEGISRDRCGCLDHFAFFVEKEDVDRILAKVAAAGYEVTMEPTDAGIDTVPPYNFHIAFFNGPYGESVELFSER